MCLAFGGATHAQSGSAPNVLLITVDTLRADHLETYGYKDVKTPAINGLAADGVLFETAISQAPMTLPSHATILTGTYPNYHGVRDVVGQLRPDIPTLAEILKTRGYRTGAFVGASVLSGRWGLNRGFDTYFDHFAFQGIRQIDFDRLERPANLVIDPAVEWLKGRKDGPFFLWVHVYDPHDPYSPPEPFLSQYKNQPYDGEIAFVDAQLGRLFSFLKEQQLYESTLIVFTSDHGEALGQHGEQHHGYYIYDESIHVPLIVKMTGSQGKGKRLNALVRSADIMPTLLQLCAAPVPGSVQGESLLGLLTGKRTQGAAAAYSESLYPKIHFGWSPLYSWRTSKQKLIQAPKPEFYDLATDPFENRNIHATQQAMAARLKSELGAQRRKFDAAVPPPDTAQSLDAETLEKLKSLGYVGFSSGTPSAPEDQLPDPKDKLGVYNQLNRAIDSSRKNSPDATIKLLEEVARVEPKMPLVHFLTGTEYFNKGWFLKAAECFQETLKYNPGSNVATYQLARSYYEAGYPEKAEPGLLRLVSVEKNHFPAFHQLATIYSKLGNLPQAIQMESRALEIRPDYAEAHNNIGSYYYQSRDLDNALKHYTRAAEIETDWALPVANQALVYLARKAWDPAEKASRRVVELQPRMAVGYYYLGQALRGKGMQNEASQAFERARQLNPRLTPPPQSPR